MIEKFVFIGGSGRCGTNWVASWLSKHPLIFSGPETHIFSHINDLLQKIGNNNDSIGWWLDNNIDVFLREMLVLFYGFRKENKTICLDHTPSNSEHINLIFHLIPDAKIILLYRDGKNVVYSFKQKGYNNTKELCNHWIKSIIQVLHYKNIEVVKDEDCNIIFEKSTKIYQSGKKKMIKILDCSCDDNIIMKYEDLIFHPELSQNITKHIGVEHHCDIKPWHEPINTTNTQYLPDMWKNSSKEELEIMKIMNPYLEALGYETI